MPDNLTHTVKVEPVCHEPQFWTPDRAEWEQKLCARLSEIGFKSAKVFVEDRFQDERLVISVRAIHEGVAALCSAIYDKVAAFTDLSITVISAEFSRLLHEKKEQQAKWIAESAPYATGYNFAAVKSQQNLKDFVHDFLKRHGCELETDDKAPETYTSYCSACGGYDNTHRIGCPTSKNGKNSCK